MIMRMKNKEINKNNIILNYNILCFYIFIKLN